MFYTYILFSKSLNIYYKGFSINIETRLIYHNSGKSPYTSKANDWELLYYLSHETKREALIEEKRLKKLNRASIEYLISKFNK
ncbi:GIY-YIG nuclease family protein [Flavobacterium anseongense]|uniref:GIY-YIG nuclease family protein n=1 Tax=Flavobacterium anseongense TaxID=2910677 RepID=UPI002106D529|nr:GIY-YIG nuclease family protein [Flavobacterium sp. AS60]